MSTASNSAAQEAPGALLRRMEWTVLRPLDGLLQGDHRLLFRGSGHDLMDLRTYQPGDDLRHIDWHVTARLQEPHVRQYAEEREVSAWFLVDLSTSMSLGTIERTPLQLAVDLVAVLARVLTRQGGRVGAVLYLPQQQGAGAIEVLPLGSGRHHVLRLIQQLQRLRTPTTRQGTDLAQLLHSAAALIRRRSAVFVLSDFLSAPGWEAPLQRLTRRHDVLAVRLSDDLEALLDALPGAGLVHLEDAETGEQIRLEAQGPGFAERARALAQAQDEQVIDALMASGADTLELAPGDALLDTLLRCVALRRRRPAGAMARRWRKTAPPARVPATPAASLGVPA